MTPMTITITMMTEGTNDDDNEDDDNEMIVMMTLKMII